MITAVDTNVLLDLLAPDSRWYESSRSAVHGAAADGSAIISETVLAELAARFAQRTGLEEFLEQIGVQVLRSSDESLKRAGVAWSRYTARRPSGLICNQCGAETQARCNHCEAPIALRQRVLGDFLIGAHALVHADRLLTRDQGYYRTYFPDLELV